MNPNPWKDASVLVTGGAGFIGSNLVGRLVSLGANVRVLDDLSTGRASNLPTAVDSVSVLEGSVVDLEACRCAVEGTSHVFHHAALPSVARSVADPVASHHAAATGTLNVLVAARDAQVSRVVYASSSSAYGDTPVLPKNEAMAAKPRSPYAVSKLAGELYAQAFFSVFKLSTVCLRYFNVFGPRQDPESKYSAAIPIFIRQALEGDSPVIEGDGGQTRDFTFVDNVVTANLRAAVAPCAAVSGKVFNVGSGERLSVLELWQRIRALLESEVEPTFGPPRKGDVRDSLADIAAARSAFGYAVEVPLDEGLRRTVDWLRSSGQV